MVDDFLTLRCDELVRYSCGGYEIEVGPGDYWCWRDKPPVEQALGLADLKALAAVASAGAAYLVAGMADIAPEPEGRR